MPPMPNRLASSFLAGLSCFVIGCPSEPDPPSSGSETGSSSEAGDPSTTDVTVDTAPDTDGATDGSSTTTGLETTADTTAAATDTADTDTADTDTATDTTDTAGACQVWEITYDLEGSEFEISDTPLNAGDQVNVLTMPYDADDTVGPGTFVLRFEDVDGAPGGMAAMVAYQMSMHFVVDSGFTTVSTDLEADAGPDECGVTTGSFGGDTVAWMPSAIVGHHSMGQILCEGGLCGAGGLPDGMPVAMDEVTDQPVSDFVFSMDRSSFTMEQTVIAMDTNSTTAWTYMGTETSRELVDAPPCLCP